nr:hypothetical protein [Bradyrhizobium sp.]
MTEADAVPDKTSDEPGFLCSLPESQVLVQCDLGQLAADAHPHPADLAHGVSAKRSDFEGLQRDFIDLLADASPEFRDGVVTPDDARTGRHQSGVSGEQRGERGKVVPQESGRQRCARRLEPWDIADFTGHANLLWAAFGRFAMCG